MTKIEKELHQMIIDHIHTNDDGTTLLKAIIERYPQILAEKVLCDVPNAETIKDFSSHFKSCAFGNKKIEVYIREVKEC